MENIMIEKYKKLKNYFTFQQPLVWKNVIGLTIIHVLWVYALIFVIPKTRFLTTVWGIIVGNLSGLGVTAGAHRLWTHKSYKARLPLRIFLMVMFVTSGQYSLESWVRDHRTHHKFTDTDADPHNAKRGFFFSHCGWLMMKRHPEVKKKGKLIDISDLKKDPVVRFQQKYFTPLHIFFFIIMPSAVSVIVFGETLYYAIMETFFFRYGLQLNSTWIVNSIAHLYGTRPYNKNIMAVQSTFVSFFTQGEGWHNFHHVFPWDYRVGEVGQSLQTAGHFIKFCNRWGLAYDLKSAPPDMIARVVAKQGMLDVQEMPLPEDEGVNESNNIIKKKNNVSVMSN